jgi:hypothetical protein
MSRLLNCHIFKYTVLEQANLLYWATATVQSRIRDKKPLYKLYKQNRKRNRTAIMQIRPSQIMVMLG